MRPGPQSREFNDDVSYTDYVCKASHHREAIIEEGGKFLMELPSRAHRVGVWTSNLQAALRFDIATWKDGSGVSSRDPKLTQALKDIRKYAVPSGNPRVVLLAPQETLADYITSAIANEIRSL